MSQFTDNCLDRSNHCQRSDPVKGFEVKDHFLHLDGQRVPYKPSPNHGDRNIPRIVVIHYTATNGLSSPLSWLTTPKSQVSAHLIMDKDGTVYQLLPFNVAAWHAGRSEYNGKTGVNSFSIGIENVGMGDNWPAAQIEANRGILQALFEAYPTLEDIVGHEDVATPPGRKSDPGPNYPWSEVTEG